MKTVNLNEIHLRLENEVNHLAQSILYYQKDVAKEDAHDAVMLLEPEIDGLILQLSQQKLSFGEFDSMVLKKKDEIELSGLRKNGLSQMELEMVRFGIIHTICNTVFNCVVEIDESKHHDSGVEDGLDKELGVS